MQDPIPFVPALQGGNERKPRRYEDAGHVTHSYTCARAHTHTFFPSNRYQETSVQTFLAVKLYGNQTRDTHHYYFNHLNGNCPESFSNSSINLVKPLARSLLTPRSLFYFKHRLSFQPWNGRYSMK